MNISCRAHKEYDFKCNDCKLSHFYSQAVLVIHDNGEKICNVWETIAPRNGMGLFPMFCEIVRRVQKKDEALISTINAFGYAKLFGLK